jgi:hypothetical protein
MTDSTSASLRPYWLSQPCPPWCAAEHRDYDQDSDRDHRGDQARVVLLTENADYAIVNTVPDNVQAAEMRASLDQGQRDAEPRVAISHNGEPEVMLTLGEADELAGRLLDLVKLGLG